MNITINSVHFKADIKLEEFIQKKVEKLSQYSDDIVEATVFLRLENTSDKENKISEIKIDYPRAVDLFAKKQCSTFEEGIDLAVNALKVKLVKTKQKIRG